MMKENLLANKVISPFQIQSKKHGCAGSAEEQLIWNSKIPWYKHGISIYDLIDNLITERKCAYVTCI